MIGKYILSLRTSRALKSNQAIRIAEGYRNATSIGVLFSYQGHHHFEQSMELVEKMEGDGKTVDTITFVHDHKKSDYNFTSFCEKDLNVSGNWNNVMVEKFKESPYDYLVCLDQAVNKFTKNILASSKAKCRVGSFKEGQSDFFELMIHTENADYQRFLDQVYHYIKKVNK